MGQEVKGKDNSVVVHELELAIKRDLYGRLWSLCNQSNVVLRHDSRYKVKHSWKISRAFAGNQTRVAR